jgi:hypothetical protein
MVRTGCLFLCSCSIRPNTRMRLHLPMLSHSLGLLAVYFRLCFRRMLLSASTIQHINFFYFPLIMPYTRLNNEEEP